MFKKEEIKIKFKNTIMLNEIFFEKKLKPYDL